MKETERKWHKTEYELKKEELAMPLAQIEIHYPQIYWAVKQQPISEVLEILKDWYKGKLKQEYDLDTDELIKKIKELRTKKNDKRN